VHVIDAVNGCHHFISMKNARKFISTFCNSSVCCFLVLHLCKIKFLVLIQ